MTPNDLMVTHATRLISTPGVRRVNDVLFLPNGRVAGAADHIIELWDLASSDLKQTLSAHTARVSCLACSPDGSLLASGSDDATIRLWQVDTGYQSVTLFGHDGAVHSIAMSSDGRLLASGGADGTVRLWDLTTGTAVRTLLGYGPIVQAVAFSPVGMTLASGDSGGYITLRDIGALEVHARWAAHEGPVNAVAFSPDGVLLASGGDDVLIAVWEVATQQGHRLEEESATTQSTAAVTFDPTGAIIGRAGRWGWPEVTLWDAASGQILAEMTHHNDDVTSLAFDHSGAWLAVGCGGDGRHPGEIEVWRIEKTSH